jgi:nitrogen-specific signal transduction histidine kinase
VATLFDTGLDRSALERMLLASATHPSGPGFARAHLLIWNPDRDCLDGRLAWVGGGPRTLGEVMGAARLHASDGTDPDATRRLQALRLSPAELDGALALAWTTRRTAIGAADVFRPCSGAETLGVVPLACEGRAYGLVVGEWGEPGHSAARAASLDDWRTFVNGALAVHTRAELARRRAERAEALASFARATVGSANLAEIANTLVRLAAHATGARGAVLWRTDSEGTLTQMSSFGPAGVRDRLGRGLTPVASRCAASGRPVVHDRVAEAEELAPEVATQLSTVAAAPVAAYGRGLGALAIYDRLGQHPNDRMAFDAEDVACLSALADQCAIAFEQARADDARREMEQARRDLLHQLARSERQAAAAEAAVRAVQDGRNPLATIGAFARRVHRSLAEDDPNREYLEVVIREAERLERVLAQPLETISPEGPRLKVESLNGLVQAALQAAGERLVRRRVRLLKKLSPDLPPLLLDAERLGRVIHNLLGHALERVNPGGRVRVESRRVQQFAVLEVAHDGPAHPGDLMSELFVPFVLGGTESADLGLAMARQVVWQHGGEVRVRSEGEWSAVFTLTLPVRGNEDRRRPSSDRRVTRRDRRARSPVPAA